MTMEHVIILFYLFQYIVKFQNIKINILQLKNGKEVRDYMHIFFNFQSYRVHVHMTCITYISRMLQTQDMIA